jgi:hypothetical protein
MHDELRRAVRRVEPPAGFADRVLRAAKAEPVSPKPAVAPKALWRAKAGWAVAATLMIATLGGGVWYRAEERRKQEGEEAKRQVLLSLNIAGSKLRSIEMKVNHGEGR